MYPSLASSSQAFPERMPEAQPSTRRASDGKVRRITATNSGFKDIRPDASRTANGTFHAPAAWPARNSSTVRTSTYFHPSGPSRRAFASFGSRFWWLIASSGFAPTV